MRRQSNNITDKAVDCIGRCIGKFMKVTANYDADNKVSTLSGKHSKPSRKKNW